MKYDKASILKAYSDSLNGRSPQYLKHAEAFLNHSGGFEREHIEGYVNWLRDQDYADGTINLIFGIIKRMFKVNEIDFPFEYKERPLVQTAFKPSLDPAIIRKMIGEARIGNLTQEETFYLFMSSVYGLRVGEMAALNRKDINTKTGTVFVRTLKGGHQKYHILPTGAEKYVEISIVPTSTNKLNRLYLAIERKIGIRHYEGTSWHAFRRTLDRELIFAGLSQYIIKDFLRWAIPKNDMVGVYFESQQVGMDGVKVGPGSRDAKSDYEVFKVHPFLKDWRVGYATKT